MEVHLDKSQCYDPVGISMKQTTDHDGYKAMEQYEGYDCWWVSLTQANVKTGYFSYWWMIFVESNFRL